MGQRKPIRAVYSGTFDPLTLGHEDVARRAARMFDHVIVAVALAHHKVTLFDITQRVALAQQSFADTPNISVKGFDGLLIDYCRDESAGVIVRGVRNTSDFDYEEQLAGMNRRLSPEVDTVFLLPQTDLQCISSTLVREISRLGGDIRSMVSPHVADALQTAFGQAAHKS